MTLRLGGPLPEDDFPEGDDSLGPTLRVSPTLRASERLDLGAMASNRAKASAKPLDAVGALRRTLTLGVVNTEVLVVSISIFVGGPSSFSLGFSGMVLLRTGRRLTLRLRLRLRDRFLPLDRLELRPERSPSLMGTSSTPKSSAELLRSFLEDEDVRL